MAVKIRPLQGILTAELKSDEHCNLDSLPLRFGFMVKRTCMVDLKLLSKKKSTQEVNRYKCDARIDFQDIDDDNIEKVTDRTSIEGTFIYLQHENGSCTVITAYPTDETNRIEPGLSDLIRKLRESKSNAPLITPKWLLSKHQDYVNGNINSTESLFETLVKDRGKIPKDVRLIEDAVKELKLENAELEKENKRLEKELRKYARKSSPPATPSSPTVIGFATITGKATSKAAEEMNIFGGKLVKVNKNVSHRGSSCTQLVLESGEKWYMKTATFDSDLSITRRAEVFEGRWVRLAVWGPKDDPLKWAKQHYFRDIYLSNSDALEI